MLSMAHFRWGLAQTRPVGGCPLHISAQGVLRAVVCSCFKIGLGLLGSQVLPSCWESALIW